MQDTGRRIEHQAGRDPDEKVIFGQRTVGQRGDGANYKTRRISIEFRVMVSRPRGGENPSSSEGVSRSRGTVWLTTPSLLLGFPPMSPKRFYLGPTPSGPTISSLSLLIKRYSLCASSGLKAEIFRCCAIAASLSLFTTNSLPRKNWIS